MLCCMQGPLLQQSSWWPIAHFNWQSQAAYNTVHPNPKGKFLYFITSHITLHESMKLTQCIVIFRILVGCSFTGDIPQELGNLVQLSFL